MKLATIDLKGKEYATVPTRLKEFREQNPRALVETKPNFNEDGTVVFTARIVKDKSDEFSAEATGHAYGKLIGDKSFEKLETIACGRALALLGYLHNGQVATGEEMEEFEAFKEELKVNSINEAIKKLDSAKTLDELKKIFVGLGSVMSEPEVIEAKDEKKEALK